MTFDVWKFFSHEVWRCITIALATLVCVCVCAVYDVCIVGGNHLGCTVQTLLIARVKRIMLPSDSDYDVRYDGAGWRLCC